MITVPEENEHQPVETETHLSEYWAVVVKRRRLIGICVVVALVIGVAASLITPSTFRATTVLDVEREKSSLVVAQRVVERLNLVHSDEFNPARKALPSTSSADASKELLPRVAARIQSGIDVVPVRGTNLVELSYVASSPKIAADIANAVADSYIDWNVES